MFAAQASVISSLHVISALLSDKLFVEATEVRASFDTARAMIRKLIDENEVPFLAVFRFKPGALRKHGEWKAVWVSQRAEEEGSAPATRLAPKYVKGDFTRNTYWELRGKLDVPKERFISYPGCESDQDNEPVYGWAGWNHLQRAHALANLYQDRKTNEGWQADRLTPMLAGLLELIPWVKQWHNDPDPDFGGLRMGDYFDDFLQNELQTLGLTRDDLESWRPPKKQKRKRASSAKKTTSKKRSKRSAKKKQTEDSPV